MTGESKFRGVIGDYDTGSPTRSPTFGHGVEGSGFADLSRGKWSARYMVPLTKFDFISAATRGLTRFIK